MLNLHRIPLCIKGVSELSVRIWDIVPWVKINTKHHNYNQVSVRYDLTSASLHDFVSVLNENA